MPGRSAGGTWVGVGRRFLDITQWDPSVERGGDERVAQSVRADRLVDTGVARNPTSAFRSASVNSGSTDTTTSVDAAVVVVMATSGTQVGTRRPGASSLRQMDEAARL